VTVISLKTFSVADTYSKADANTLLAAKATTTALATTNTAVALKSPIASPVFTGPLTSESAAATNIVAKSTNGNGGYMNYQGLASNGTQTFAVNHNGTIFTTSGLAVGGTGANNTLDDYEEGTWTPTIGGNSTYNNQVGRYIKIGNMVWVNFAIGINAQGSGSTISQISGLPFTSGLASQNTSNLTWHGLGVAMTYGVYYVGANSTTLSLSYTTGASTQLTNNPNSLVNGASMNGTFVYTI